MTDEFDLEAQMAAESERAARIERARARVREFNALPREEQRRRLLLRPDPEQMANATRTHQLHDQPGLHARLARLEDECLDLLRPADADRLRRNR